MPGCARRGLRFEVEAQLRELRIGQPLAPVVRARPGRAPRCRCARRSTAAAAARAPSGCRSSPSDRCTGPRCRRRISAGWFGTRRGPSLRGRERMNRRVRLRDLAHRHPDVGPRAFDVDLARIRQRLDRGLVDAGRGAQELGIGVHGLLLSGRLREEQWLSGPPRFPTTALPVSGSKGLSHPERHDSILPQGPLTCALYANRIVG